MKWQPIETAPKDGTPILAVIKGYIPNVVQYISAIKRFVPCSHLDMDSKFASELDEELIMGTSGWNPTHWMPLPSPLESAT